MAIIKVIKNDLLDLFKRGAFQAIAHGCNCQNKMGAGIADQIRKQLPEAYAADTEFHKRMQGKNLEGQLSVGHTDIGQVFNLYTQTQPGPNADYQYLQTAMQNLNKFCKQRSIKRVGVPLIGAGIGGLDIIAAMTIINACTPDIDVVVVVWKDDEKSWRQASKFHNFTPPFKFLGVAARTTRPDVLDLRSGADSEWLEVTFDPDQARVMHHHGERYLSASDYTPVVLLLIDHKEQYDMVKDRLYTE